MAKILLVDDMGGIRTAIGGLLRSRGHEVVDAADGEAGLKALSSQRFDVVLTDMVMPNIDGSDFITALKARNPGQPVIAMSGGSQGIDGGQMLDLAAGGADKCLPKPFARNDLLQAIEDLCPTGQAL